MSTNQTSTTPVTHVIEVGTLVIMQDGRRAVIEQVLPGAEELHYVIRTHDGEQLDVEAGKVIRAKVYANWVAPGSSWDGEERRKNRAPNGNGSAPRRRAEDRPES